MAGSHGIKVGCVSTGVSNQREEGLRPKKKGGEILLALRIERQVWTRSGEHAFTDEEVTTLKGRR